MYILFHRIDNCASFEFQYNFCTYTLSFCNRPYFYAYFAAWICIGQISILGWWSNFKMYIFIFASDTNFIVTECSVYIFILGYLCIIWMMYSMNGIWSKDLSRFVKLFTTQIIVERNRHGIIHVMIRLF